MLHHWPWPGHDWMLTLRWMRMVGAHWTSPCLWRWYGNAMPPGGMELITGMVGMPDWGDKKPTGESGKISRKISGFLDVLPQEVDFWLFWGHPTNRDFFWGIPQAPVVQIPTVEDNNVEIVSEIRPDSMNRVGTTFRRGFDRGSILDWLVVTGTMEFYDFPSGMSSSQLTKSYLSEGLNRWNHQPVYIYITIGRKQKVWSLLIFTWTTMRQPFPAIPNITYIVIYVWTWI